jgi:hypothetical protein
MPIVSNFPTGGGSGSSGLALGAVSNVSTVVSHGKAYFKWTDPEDIVVSDSTLAAFSGTILVRKAGSAPVSRRDGTVVVDSKTRNAYQNTYFCDSGLTDGVTYYYKFFTYTTQNVYTDLEENLVEITPVAVTPANVSGMSVAAAGNGKVTLKWTDPDNTTQDGITTVAWGGSKVIYKKGSRPTSESDGTLVLNSTTKNAYKSTGLTISGLENGATYYFAVFPYGTDAYGGAVNTNASNVISGVPNRLTITNVPNQSGSLTYTGSAQTPSWSNYDSSKMTLSVTAQTNAGTYSASFTPKDDYMWPDGTTAAKSVNWTIGKAAGSLSLSKSSITLNSSTKSTTFTVTRAGDGKITVESSDTTVATVSLNGTTVTVSSVNDKTGKATITVKVAAGTNHTAPSNKTCAVSCEFLPAVGTPLNNISWADIKRISDAGLASNYFAVGDRKAVALSGTVGNLSLSGTYYCYIIGINHNSAKEGANRIHFQFGKTAASGGTDICFVDSGYGSNKTSGSWFNMNNSQSNSGGWNNSRMRTVICPAFKSAMPSDLQAVLKTTTKYSDNTGGGSNTASYVTATSEEVFLLAEFEVFGARSYANSAEQNYQTQYAYYSAGNSKVKYRHSATGSTAYWWLRSVRADNSAAFCLVDTSGSATVSTVSNSLGFAPAFCV